MLENRPKTIFCDIDGTLIAHYGDGTKQHLRQPVILPGVSEKIKEWDRKGFYIILVTGRKESTRKHTEEQLAISGIVYDQLIMGIGGGVRVLINDRKPDFPDDTAVAINLDRNIGFSDVNI